MMNRGVPLRPGSRRTKIAPMMPRIPKHDGTQGAAAMSGWLDTARFPFLRGLESEAGSILAELRRILDRPVWTIWGTRRYTPTFTRMTAGEIRRTIEQGGARVGGGDETSWKLFGLYLHGAAIEDGCRACPHTAAVLEETPGLVNAGFSCLEAGHVIAPHTGNDRRFYRTHLGLVVPPGDCALEVDGEARRWEAGKTLAFDDTHPHAAWNRTGEHRFVLIVDVARAGQGAEGAPEKA